VSASSAPQPAPTPSRVAHLVQGLAFTGHLPADLSLFLRHHSLPKTLAHSLRVGQMAYGLALRFAVDPHLARLAGWLHDCSAVIPTPMRLQAALSWGIEVLPEEAAFPLILHQKLSVVIAAEVFGINHPSILSAVGCHTTLKAGASPLDKIVFIADKLAWDQPGDPSYQAAVQNGLSRSLDASVLAYINILIENRPTLPGPLHPWLLQAHAELTQTC